jgi:hypothetical protein
VVANALSRISCIKPSNVTALISSLVNLSKVEDPISLAELRDRAAMIRKSNLVQAQEADSRCFEMRLELLASSTLPHLRSFSLQNKLLSHSAERSASGLVVPMSMVQQVIIDSSQHTMDVTSLVIEGQKY